VTCVLEMKCVRLGPMAEEPIRVVIADDHAVVRSGLRMLLEAQEDLHVIAEAGDVHRSHIQHKTRLSSRAELVRYAIDHGLIST